MHSLSVHPSHYKKIIPFFLESSIRMSAKCMNFGDEKILENDFYKNKM